MEYRIRKSNGYYIPEFNKKTLYGTDTWFSLDEYHGYSEGPYCALLDEAREVIKNFHYKNIEGTKDDESSIVEKFTL